jgi:hypothetical protein
MRSPFLLLVVLFIMATITTSAQLRQRFVRTIKPTSDSTDRKLSILNALNNKKWYHAGIQVDSVAMGKVYRMPFDNMLCIVPDATKNSPMPVQRTRRMPKMPNAYRGPGMNR